MAKAQLPPVGRTSLFFLLFVLLVVLLVTDLSFGTPNLRVGQVVPTDVVAPHRVVNVLLYDQLRAAAERQVAPIYVSDPGTEAAMAKKVAAILARVEATEATLGQDHNRDDQVAAWQSHVGLPLPAADVHAILAEPAAALKDLETDADVAIGRVLAGASYTAQQLDAERQNLDSAVLSLMLPSRAQEDFLSAVLRQVASPNMVYSPAATAQARDKAAASVPAPVIEPGQVVLPRGTRVTAADLRLLKALGLARQGFGASALAGAVLVASLFSLGLYAYLSRYQPELLEDRRKLLVYGFVVLLTLLLARLLATFSPYLVPLPFAAMTVALLLSPRFALFLSTLVVLLLTFALDLDTRVVIVLAVAALAGALAMGRFRERNGFLWAPLLAAGAAVSTLLAMGLVGYPWGSYGSFWPDLAWSGVNGLFSGVLCIGVLPFFEHALGVVSPIRLLELSSPSQPLLKRLLMEAPGTYHHSLVVANLAAAAAEAIGADTLLSRVGAYYHDVGKLKRPAFFVDNQTEGENPHDRISPNLSALILASHVQDGLALARGARLPKEVQAFIAEHHGTTLMSYFYHRAQEQLGGEVREEDFRYEGPRPQSRETALVMLADGVEAATRAMKGRTPERVDALVRKLIRERLLDGQLDESGLTLRDLDRVAKAFVHVLAGAYHARVEYPEVQDFPNRRGKLESRGEDGQPADQHTPTP